MGIMRLALPWAKISLRRGPQGVRLDGSELPQRSSSPAEDLHGNAMDDAALASACRAGDLAGFERLYDQHASRMKSVARNLLGSSSEAEDAVQDTFLKIQRSIASFRGQSSFATWSFRILINTCYDARRSRLRKKEVTSEQPDDAPPRPEAHARSSHPALRIALERALSRLTDQQRHVFLLYEVEGFRHAEIACILKISETASKNTLFQAKKALRQMLEAPRSSGAEVRWLP
jgi:RNA polymerase sigma-70 factor (ECF subfamily)